MPYMWQLPACAHLQLHTHTHAHTESQRHSNYNKEGEKRRAKTSLVAQATRQQVCYSFINHVCTDRQTGRTSGQTHTHIYKVRHDRLTTHTHTHPKRDRTAWTLQVAATFFQLRLQLALKSKRGILSILCRARECGGGGQLNGVGQTKTI